jgi:hypothetical protein
MATLTKLSASQYSLKYRYSGNASESATKTQDQLVADCAEGALKKLLQSNLSQAEWAALPEGGKLSVYTTNEDKDSLVGATMPGSPKRLVVASGGTSNAAIVEIRAHHSIGY